MDDRELECCGGWDEQHSEKDMAPQDADDNATEPSPAWLEMDRVLQEWNTRLRAFFMLEQRRGRAESSTDDEGTSEPVSAAVLVWLRNQDAVFQEWNRRFREFFVWERHGEALESPSHDHGPSAIIVFFRHPDGVLQDWNRRLRAFFLRESLSPASDDCDRHVGKLKIAADADGSNRDGAWVIDESPYIYKPSSYLKVLPDHQLERKWHHPQRSLPRVSLNPRIFSNVTLPTEPPPMSICIMIVGTRGDVQPFLAIAKRLQQDGHRVRLATHAIYRDFVVNYGVEFYPLGGDPKELASYMVKTGGRLIPMKLETLQKDVPRNMQMIEEILESTWPAVSAPDPDGEGPGVAGQAFRADAIISNPVTYGHIHVAEKLGVPLHIMFPQPWVPTVAFPHPLSNLPYQDKPQRRNYLSYKIVDLLMWEGTERLVNKFRTSTLDLRKIRKGDGGRDLLLDMNIPHAFMWSPALVPKPADWGEQYDVIGTVTIKGAGSDYTPSPELEAFLGDDGGPIFVGFGSMVLEDPIATTKMIIEAATLANVRVLIQSSWSNMAGDLAIPSNVFFVGECPHDWLMPRVSAVVHHGGAGTTAGGLLAGKPTFIVPFFGDQPFWGRAVVTAGVGVEPCRITELTVEKLRAAFEELQEPDIRSRAKLLQQRMQQEDGVEGAVKSFYRHLPMARMVCDLCHHRIPVKWSVHDRQKLCEACSYIVESRPENYWKRMVKYRCVDYRRKRERQGASEATYHQHVLRMPVPQPTPSQLLAEEVGGAVDFIHEVGGVVKDVSHFLVLSCFSSWDVVAVV